MRYSNVEIHGKNYIACLSARVLSALEERNGKDATQELQTILAGGKTCDIMWMLYQLLRAGEKYAELEEIPCDKLPPQEDLEAVIGIDDFEEIAGQIAKVVTESQKTTIDIRDEGKNPEASPTE